MEHEIKCCPATVNDFTIRQNWDSYSVGCMGQNRVAFDYRQYVINSIKDVEVDFDEWDHETLEQKIQEEVAYLTEEMGCDLLSVNVVMKWPNGTFTFFPCVANDVHAVFWVVESVDYPCCDGCYIAISPHFNCLNNGSSDGFNIDTEDCSFISGQEFFTWRNVDGR